MKNTLKRKKCVRNQTRNSRMSRISGGSNTRFVIFTFSIVGGQEPSGQQNNDDDYEVNEWNDYDPPNKLTRRAKKLFTRAARIEISDVRKHLHFLHFKFTDTNLVATSAIDASLPDDEIYNIHEIIWGINEKNIWQSEFGNDKSGNMQYSVKSNDKYYRFIGVDVEIEGSDVSIGF